MKGFIFIFLFNVSLISSEDVNTSIFNHPYIFTYIFTNPSLGPIDGIEIARVIILDGKIVDVWDLKTGSMDADIRGLKSLIDIVNGGKTKGTKVEYNSYHFPKQITPILDKDRVVGGGYSIETKDFKSIDDPDFSFDIDKERMSDFTSNRLKWHELGIRKYTFTYQDSSERGRYMEGVEVTIENGIVIKARDVRSYQLLTDLSGKSFLTVSKLFDIVGRELKEKRQISILYDKKYGYPYWISLKEKNGKIHSIISRSLRKDFK